MESSDALQTMNLLLTDVRGLLRREIKYPDWKTLQYSRYGVSVLHNEYKLVAAHYDWCAMTLHTLLATRNDVVAVLRSAQASYEKVWKKKLYDNVRKWQLAGYSQSEREAFAKIDTDDLANSWQDVQLAVDAFDEQAKLVEKRIKVLDDFKYSARLLQQTLNFGHALQELL